MKSAMRFGTKFEIIPSSIHKLNPQFSLCDILVLYPGDNPNGTCISRETVEHALYSLYGVPIIGEWIQKDDGAGDWGSHGGRVVIDEHGVRFEQTTKPFGFVTKDAVDHAEWVTVTEKDGHTRHDYLSLRGCILWNARYEECSSLLEKNYGQSMEIEILDGFDRPGGMFEITEFIFSALCILGSTEPCFESACIGRHYARQKEVRRMIDEYQRCLTYSTHKEELENLKKKLSDILSAVTFQTQTGKSVPRYAVIAVREGEVDAVDRDGYKGCVLPYSTGEDGAVTVDFEHAQERPLVLGKTGDPGFDAEAELERAASERAAFAIEAHENEAVRELTEKLSSLTASYEQLQAEYASAEKELARYRDAQAQAAEAQHRAEIDAKLDEYASKMGDYSEYLIYRTKVDYSKTVEQVDVDLLVMLGRYHKDAASQFSLRPRVLAVPDDPSPAPGGGRYGSLLDRVRKSNH